MKTNRLSAAWLIGALFAAAAYAQTPLSDKRAGHVRPAAQGVIHHPLPDFPIAAAVEIPAGSHMVYLSGIVPTAVNPKLPATAQAAFGETYTQADNVFAQIKTRLASLGLGMKDIVKMQVYLKAPEGQKQMDFKGFQTAYLKYFDARSPRLPVRSTFQVAGLANPGWLVEIEVTAVRP